MLADLCRLQKAYNEVKEWAAADERAKQKVARNGTKGGFSRNGEMQFYE